jgi:hypothetical protein
MLYKVVLASTIAAAAAFQAPLSAVATRSGAVTMGDDWRRSYDGRGGTATGYWTAGGAVASAAPSGGSSSGVMSITQAMAFMQAPALDSVSLDEKIAFLKDKGLSEAMIAGASCVSPLDKFGPVQGHP